MKSFGTLAVTFGATVALSFFSGCKKSTTEEEETIQDNVTNVVESVLSEATSSNSALSSDIISTGFSAEEDFRSSPKPLTTCSLSNVRSSCSSDSKSIDFAGCKVGSESSQISIQGLITETWSGTGSSLCRMLGDQAKLTRLIDSESPKVVTLASGATITTKPASEAAYDDTTFDQASTGTVITRIHSGTSNSQTCGTTASTACFNVVINGLQKTMVGPKGKTWFNHIITANLTRVGDRVSADQTLTGTSTVWHQIASYKAVNTFNNVRWSATDDCRFPTSGSISTVLTGAIEGNVTTTFSTTCGEATFVDTDESETTITLSLTE